MVAEFSNPEIPEYISVIYMTVEVNIYGPIYRIVKILDIRNLLNSNNLCDERTRVDHVERQGGSYFSRRSDPTIVIGEIFGELMSCFHWLPVDVYIYSFCWGLSEILYADRNGIFPSPSYFSTSCYALSLNDFIPQCYFYVVDPYIGAKLPFGGFFRTSYYASSRTKEAPSIPSEGGGHEGQNERPASYPLLSVQSGRFMLSLVPFFFLFLLSLFLAERSGHHLYDKRDYMSRAFGLAGIVVGILAFVSAYLGGLWIR